MCKKMFHIGSEMSKPNECSGHTQSNSQICHHSAKKEDRMFGGGSLIKIKPQN